MDERVGSLFTPQLRVPGRGAVAYGDFFHGFIEQSISRPCGATLPLSGLLGNGEGLLHMEHQLFRSYLAG
jgi:hypothetical protein